MFSYIFLTMNSSAAQQQGDKKADASTATYVVKWDIRQPHACSEFKLEHKLNRALTLAQMSPVRSEVEAFGNAKNITTI